MNRPPEGPYDAWNAWTPVRPAGPPPGWPNPYAAPPPPTAPTYSRAIPVLSALIVLLLIAGGLLFVFGSNDSGAQGRVIDAIRTAFSEKSVHVTLTNTVSTNGSGVGTVTVAGVGDIDFPENAMQVHETIHAEGQSETADVIYLNGSVYEQIPGIEQVLPGKSWISIDLSQLAKAAGSSGNLNNVGSDPLAILGLLDQQGNTVTPTGSTTIDGVAVDGYDVDVNTASITAMLQSPDLPSWLRQAVSAVHLNQADEQVFIDGTGNLRRMTSSVDESAGPISISEQTDTEYSNYGEAVTITAPPADQVATIQQLLQMAGSTLT